MAGTIRIAILANAAQAKREIQSVPTAAQKIGKTVKTVLGTGLKVAGATGGLLLGAALTKGLGRLQAIENAKAKLRGLGNDTKAVDAIMKNALASVKGTSFGLGEAATTAAGAVAAGIKPGKQLEGVLKVVANSASAAGTGMAEMGSIFNKAASTGKVQNDVLAQLADRGIPIYQALGKEMGKSTDKVFKLASEGKISFETFTKAAKAASGNVAKEMGTTLTGRVQNAWAAIGRVGANLLSGIYPQISDLVLRVTEALGPIEDKAKGIGTVLGKWVGDGVRVVLPLLSSLGSALGPVFAALPGIFSAVVGAITTVLATGRALVKWGQEHRTTVTVLATVITTLLLPAIIGTGVQATVAAAKQAAAWAVASTAGIRSAAVQMAAHYRVVAGWVLSSAAAIKSGAETAVIWLMLQADAAKAAAATVAAHVRMAAAWLVSKVQAVAATAVVAAQWVAQGVAAAASSAVVVAANVRMAASFAAQKVAMLAGVAAMAVVRGATVAWTAAQWLLNAALTANPIGLIIAGIALLVAGLVLAYKKSETFRNIVNAAFNAVKNTALAAWNAIRAAAVRVWSAITSAVRVQINAVRNVINGLKSAASAAWNGIRSAAVTAWTRIKSAFIAQANGIKSTFSSVRSKAAEILGRIRSLFSPSALYGAGVRLIQGLANGVAAKIGAVIQKVRDAVAKIKAMLPGSPIKEGPLKSWNNGGAGKRLMGLLASGIAAGAPAVERQLGDVLAQIANPTVTPSVALGGLDGIDLARYGTIQQITLEVQVDRTMSLAEVGRQIKQSLDAYAREGGR